MSRLAAVLLCLTLVVPVLAGGGGTTAPPVPEPVAEASTADPAPVNTDPRLGEAPLSAADGWNAFLVLDNAGVGVWTVGSFQVFPQFGCPEVVGLDDRGRCHVVAGYSGRWTPHTVIEDGAWLGGLAHDDVDPRIPGRELYVGGAMGNLWQVHPHRHDRLEPRIVAFLSGLELQALVPGDFEPVHAGPELVVFTNPPAVWLATPDGPHGTFSTRKLGDLPGLVRQAVRIPPARPGAPPEVACVSRDGRLTVLTFGPDGPATRLVHREAMGMGRIAVRPRELGETVVLYSTLDDGRILRHVRRDDARWDTETIFLGPQGPRGIAVGRFFEDRGKEGVAVFGYSRKIQLISRGDDGWEAETIFTDIDKGHSIATAEVDGRNSTDELVASGFGGRIVLLARPPGYGRTETTDEDD